MDKLTFLQTDYINLLQQIDPNTKPVFGKMNVHQMIEHMSYAFKQASGLIPLPAVNDEATTQKMYTFMMSDKAFRDNTPNPYLPDEPEAPLHSSIAESIISLEKDINHFKAVFENEPDLRFLNPFFGNLKKDEWIHLLHKHAMHHLRQFNQTQ